MSKIRLHWIEEFDGKNYITIGTKAPWNNPIWIRFPRQICKAINRYILWQRDKDMKERENE